MEQILLCSLTGHSDFLNNQWIASILKLQMKSGCFSFDGHDCSSHMTGLAAASLAVFGKYLE
jgi:hypothetical protein